ncbi:DNA primase family protein [Cupriavidus sp. CP313]
MSRVPPFEPIRFAEKLEKSGNYASDNSLLYEWTGTHWKAIDDAMGERIALKWIASDGRGTINAANARAAYQTAVRWLPMLGEPSETTVIPVRNGYLHLDHGLVLEPHDKSLGLRHVLSCDFDPGAPAPNEFNAFMERILPDAGVRARVQEYVGYTLLPDARFQRAQIWLGPGANGKGTLANLVQALHERTAAVQLDGLDGFRMASMIGASLIYCDEAPQRNINEQAMKSLIAGELVQIDRKYRDPITVRVNGKWLILANHIPAVTDQSTGFWRRFDVVPFSVEIPESERDPLLAKRIIARELSGVLNWALEGLQRLLARGRFDEAVPASMRVAAQSARTETNSVQAWSHDLGIELTTTVETSKVDVYANYAGWCRENGMVPVASPKFWKRLPDSIGAVAEGRMLTKAGRVRTCNIRL